MVADKQRMFQCVSMSVDARATGWKIPLLFCAVVGLLVGLTALWRVDTSPVPELPPPLLEQARGIVIDLNQSPEGRIWKEQISATAGGFVTRADKDTKITQMVRTAAEQRHFDAACTAAVLMYNDHQRDAVLAQLAQSAAQNCDSLPWGAMAAKGMKDKKQIISTHLMLIEEWQRCQRQPAPIPADAKAD